jgi:hypothetical protein
VLERGALEGAAGREGGAAFLRFPVFGAFGCELAAESDLLWE